MEIEELNLKIKFCLKKDEEIDNKISTLIKEKELVWEESKKLIDIAIEQGFELDEKLIEFKRV